MAIKPEIGESGGQQYDVARAIQTFLGQMAEGGIGVASAVIKELLQNADDAGASEVSVILDERVPPKDLPVEYRPLLPPAIIVRNNMPFKRKEDVSADETDDFRAICDVARGHKRAQATAAGRFGIGFNSVYFVTDTPVIFSRREIHVFDLLHRVFADNGWCFRLDEFPRSSASLAGPVKNVVDWLFPATALGASQSIGAIANAPDGDYRQAVVRLPLRNTDEGIPALHPDRFRNEASRECVLNEMAQQAAKSLLFLKQVRKVTFERLEPERRTSFFAIEVSEQPPEFERFLRDVELHSKEADRAAKLECPFYRRTIAWRDQRNSSERQWNFWVQHRADFKDATLRELRDHLRRNDERATPWGALAIPVDPDSVDSDENVPAWRVFLPLRETGPSKCFFSGAFFVGPSRQHVEFREVGSDEALRKTNWNKMLVEKVLVPMLVDSSDKLPDLIPDLIRDHPRFYLSLFPPFETNGNANSSLARYFARCFAQQPWVLRLFDVWGDRENPIEWIIGDEEHSPTIEGIPDWLIRYRDRFRCLTTPHRRFVTRAVAEALLKRMPDAQRSRIRRDVPEDVLEAVLRHSDPPDPSDLQKLIEQLAKKKGRDLEPVDMDGCWCFVRCDDGGVLRYSGDSLYIVSGDGSAVGIHDSLQQIGVAFEGTEWVESDVGLPSLSAERRRNFGNLVPEDEDGALQLLGRAKTPRHAGLNRPQLVKPIVDFLTSLPPRRLASVDRPLRLAFLVATAAEQHGRRRFGVLVLKPDTPSREDEAIWEALFRRTFAAADSNCARELHRLLRHYPDAREWLRDDQCDVSVPTAANALSVLDRVLPRFPDFLAVFREAIARPDREGHVKLATAAVIREAVHNWDRLSDSERNTLLALPIHRASDGQYVSLIGSAIGDRNTLRQRCRIQSLENDISDAPIKLSKYQLLDSAEPSAKRLYRDILELDEHNRIGILKDVLRQIGSDSEPNIRMLEYLGDHLGPTLRRLSVSSDKSEQRDANEIRQLRARAKSVPCLDGEWRMAAGCWDGWELARHLQSQGWEPEEIGSLISMLFPDRKIAALDKDARDRIRRVHGDLEQRIDYQEIAERAISSESAGLTIQRRIKLLWDNWRPSLRATPAVCIGQMTVPAISGRSVKLSEACILPTTTRRLSDAARRAFFPQAIDQAAVVDELGKGLGLRGDEKAKLEKDLRSVLVALGLDEFENKDIKRRISEDFAAVWAKLGDDAERFAVIQDIDTYELADELASTASQLNTVAVRRANDRTAWISTVAAVSPKWIETSPPLPSELCPALASANDAVQRVWDGWCGLNSFERVAEQVVRVAGGKRGSTEQAKAARAVYEWLGKVRDQKTVGEDEFVATLRGLPWVFATRGAENTFCCPNEVLFGKGQALLSHAFWVPSQNLQLPDFCRRREDLRELGFQLTLPATAENVERLASCLERCAGTDRDVAMSGYRMVLDLIDERPELRPVWQELVGKRSVFRLFRELDCVVPGAALFLGNEEDGEDYGQLLHCARAGSAKFQAEDLVVYRKLGVPDAPTTDQLLLALTKVDARTEPHRVAYHKLLAVLSKRQDGLGGVPLEKLRQVRVVTCDGRFRPLGECYWDELLGWPKHLDKDSLRWLINATDPATKEFITGLIAQLPSAVQVLTPDAVPSLRRTDSEAAVVTRLLQPWRDWCEELVKPDRVLHQEAIQAGLGADNKLELSAVERIALECRLPGGGLVRSSREWLGPSVFADRVSRIFIRADRLAGELDANSDELEKLDTEIRKQVIQLLRARETTSDADIARADEFVRDWVERPSVFLGRLRENAVRHLFHHYSDQAADREFSNLYDEFVRTREDSQRHKSLKAELLRIVENKFVIMRREQIRAYGYDEFSVLAELVQNAEDAYIQRSALGMDDPPKWYVRFWFEVTADGPVLCAEHYGRPFNHWRHEKGGNDNPDFRKDVEGVLRSSGSFKAQSEVGGTSSRVIGRFGLGFKSVFLLTDAPSIFSGEWWFRIDNGCLPTPVSRLADLPKGATQINLPLLPEAAKLPEDFGQHAMCLLPFLSRIREISIRQVDGREAKAIRHPEVPLGRGGSTGAVAERVTLAVLENGREPRSITVIRVRHPDHEGQVAMYLASDGLPAVWRDGFSRTGPDGQTMPCDFYAVLPLKSDLGCGIAVSHRFEVQSGRTHLATSGKNVEYAKQIAGLLAGLVDAVRWDWGTNRPLAERLLRFWNLWRWDRGDSETAYLRGVVADKLVELSRTQPVVPTLDEATAVSLGARPLFYFTGVPPRVVDELIAANFALDGDQGATVASASVLPRGFVEPYRRLRQFASRLGLNEWTELSWDEIGKACRSAPWLARHPSILEAIAQTASEDALDRIVAWLGDCRVLGKTGTGQETHERAAALILDDTGIPPALGRFLKFVDWTVYQRSRKLLERVALGGPSSSALREIIDAQDLTQPQAADLLRFLQVGKRWYKYDGLQRELQGRWYPGPNGRLTVAAALEARFVPADLLWEAEFKAWLGVREKPPEPIVVPEPQVPVRRPEQAGQILMDLYQWWTEHGGAWTKEFERRTYGYRGRPTLRSAPDPRDFPERKEWLRLFLLGAYQTGGRKKPEHSGGFLDRCERNNWLDTFARPESNAQDWVDVLESYLDQPTPDLLYYDDFARLFVRVFHLSRWLEHYVRSFCSISTRPPPWNLNQILTTREDPTGGGGGPDAPSVRRNLGIGACYVVRELCRLRVVSSKGKYEHRYCYVPNEAIRDMLEIIAGKTLFGAGDSPPERSIRIFGFLESQIGAAKATFDNSFDLPLIALAENPTLQAEIMGREIRPSSEDTRDLRYSHYRDERWRTLPDGRRIKLNL